MNHGGLTKDEYDAMVSEEAKHQERNALAQHKVLESWFHDYCPVYGVARYMVPNIGVRDAYQIQSMGWTYWENFQPKSVPAQPLNPDRECTCGSGYGWVMCPEASQECG